MIFSSHVHEDQELATRLRRALEKASVKCWITPCDVTPGLSYAAEIMRGIEESDAAVLLLSAHANASRMVEREVERAVTRNKTVIPLRIQGAVPGRCARVPDRRATVDRGGGRARRAVCR